MTGQGFAWCIKCFPIFGRDRHRDGRARNRLKPNIYTCNTFYFKDCCGLPLMRPCLSLSTLFFAEAYTTRTPLLPEKSAIDIWARAWEGWPDKEWLRKYSNCKLEKINLAPKRASEIKITSERGDPWSSWENHNFLEKISVCCWTKSEG